MEDWYELLISCENWTEEEWDEYEENLKQYGESQPIPLFG